MPQPDALQRWDLLRQSRHQCRRDLQFRQRARLHDEPPILHRRRQPRLAQVRRFCRYFHIARARLLPLCGLEPCLQMRALSIGPSASLTSPWAPMAASTSAVGTCARLHRRLHLALAPLRLPLASSG